MKLSNVLKAEFNIYRKSNIVKSLLIITFSFSILFGFMIGHSSSFTGSLSFLALMKGHENGFNFSMSLTYSIYNILIFFVILMASMAVSDEAQKGTLKTVLVKRVKRNDLIIGKFLFLLLFFFCLIAIISLLSLAIGGVLYGFPNISEKNYIIHSSSSLFFNYLLSLLLVVFPISALISLCLFFSVLFNNNILPLISSMGVNFIFYIFAELDFYKYLFLTDYLSFPLKTVQKMAQGLPLIWIPGIEYMILATLLYSAGFLVLAIIFFKRKEIP